MYSEARQTPRKIFRWRVWEMAGTQTRCELKEDRPVSLTPGNGAAQVAIKKLDLSKKQFATTNDLQTDAYLYSCQEPDAVGPNHSTDTLQN